MKQKEIQTALEGLEDLLDQIICSLPTSEARNAVTEMNIMRLQALQMLPEAWDLTRQIDKAFDRVMRKKCRKMRRKVGDL